MSLFHDDHRVAEPDPGWNRRVATDSPDPMQYASPMSPEYHLNNPVQATAPVPVFPYPHGAQSPYRLPEDGGGIEPSGNYIRYSATADRAGSPAAAPVGVGWTDRPDVSLAGAIGALSGGKVLAIPASGPVLRSRRVRRHALLRETFVPYFRLPGRIAIGTLTIGWLTCLVAFWVWWLQPEHRSNWVGLVLNSTLLLYLSVFPAMPVVFYNRLKKVDPRLPVPALDVAFVVTKAPSEPWETARTTLEAMLGQDYPHPYEVWLCDEDPTEEVLAWCRRHAVFVSTRRGSPEYQRDVWPRRMKCKEGNLAYFYDHWGYRGYDVVSQLDCDHIPAPAYLREIVRPFADESVGYVAAPSICDTNAADSWSARGRLYREASFHGPTQTGGNGGLAPVCIGSHYAVRTRALRDIGGVGPELAEDFSTAFLLTSAGWQGAFALDAPARGEGPPTFAALLTQEFQWSRSLTTVLLGLTGRHLRRMSWVLRFRFLNSLLYYPLLVTTTVAGLLLPAVAAVSGLQWMHVGYLEFVLRWGTVTIWLFLLALLLRASNLYRPRKAPVISWEDWLYMLVKWPFNLWGVLAAVAQRIRPSRINFKVTPKGRDGFEPLPTKLMVPFAVITLTLSGSALVGERLAHPSVGYILLCLLIGSAYALVGVAVPFLHALEAARTAAVRLPRAVARTAAAPLVLGLCAVAPLAVGWANYPFWALRFLL